MTTTEVKTAVRDAIENLRSVREGEIFEPHDVRHALAVARQLERKLRKWHFAIWEHREKAEEQFLQGWPKGHSFLD